AGGPHPTLHSLTKFHHFWCYGVPSPEHSEDDQSTPWRDSGRGALELPRLREDHKIFCEIEEAAHSKGPNIQEFD
ncbi:hypothetical protein HAX54_030995, partial [Datura stramonium]|nr:hypothetical protein [Datura stramonium]